jgi:hypothetical protein
LINQFSHRRLGHLAKVVGLQANCLVPSLLSEGNT